MVFALLSLSEVALAVAALAISATLGLLLGRQEYRGVGLGIGGVLFAGIVVGDISARLGLHYNIEMLDFVREFGLILFVFTIGIQVGPGFFASLRRSGLQLNLAASAVVLLGVVMTLAVHWLFAVPIPALVGVMSGAVTNTPGLGAATQAISDLGGSQADISQPSLGYAMTYPFGIAGILLSMMLVRSLASVQVPEEAAAWEAARRKGPSALPSLNVVVRNMNFHGLPLSEVPGLFDHGVVASRMKTGNDLIVPRRDSVVHTGDVLHLVGPADKLHAMQLVLGTESDVALTTKGTQLSWTRMVVTDKHACGRKLSALGLTEEFGVTVSRILRAGTELPAEAEATLEFGDIVTVVGPTEQLEEVRGVLGDQKQRLDQVDFPSVFIGIALGVLLGSLPFPIPGLPVPLKLGLAGGPLVAAILLGRLGRWGPFMWVMPPAVNHALREFGIVLFLAVVGVKSGDKFLDTLLNGDGILWVGYGILITLAPLLIVGMVARLVFGFNYLTLCGVLAGSMTDPPALAFANAQADSPAASIAYAAVYPLVMGLRIFAPQLIVLLLFVPV